MEKTPQEKTRSVFLQLATEAIYTELGKHHAQLQKLSGLGFIELGSIANEVVNQILDLEKE